MSGQRGRSREGVDLSADLEHLPGDQVIAGPSSIPWHLADLDVETGPMARLVDPCARNDHGRLDHVGRRCGSGALVMGHDADGAHGHNQGDNKCRVDEAWHISLPKSASASIR